MSKILHHVGWSANFARHDHAKLRMKEVANILASLISSLKWRSAHWRICAMREKVVDAENIMVEMVELAWSAENPYGIRYSNEEPMERNDVYNQPTPIVKPPQSLLECPITINFVVEHPFGVFSCRCCEHAIIYYKQTEHNGNSQHQQKTTNPYVCSYSADMIKGPYSSTTLHIVCRCEYISSIKKNGSFHTHVPSSSCYRKIAFHIKNLPSFFRENLDRWYDIWVPKMSYYAEYGVQIIRHFFLHIFKHCTSNFVL